MTKDILDYNGSVIGSLTLPDDTSDEVWAESLAAYSEKPLLKNITPRQIRLALVSMGVDLSQIDTALSSLPDPDKTLAQIQWDYSIQFERTNELVIAVASMLGWTSDQLDALWELGASL